MKIIKRIKNRIQRYLQGVIHSSVFRCRPYDYISVAYLQAAKEAAEFFRSEMKMAPNLSSKNRLLDHAVSLVEREGLWLEFGVYKGVDITRICRHTSGNVYGFDSFEGLPEDWTHFQRRGRFSLDGKLPHVPDNAKLIKGWFHETLPAFLSEHADSVGFLHIDSDLYSSAKYIFDQLGKRIVPGTIIVMDDFLNYPGWREGESKAFFEFLENRDVKCQYIGFASRHHSVAVKIIA